MVIWPPRSFIPHNVVDADVDAVGTHNDAAPWDRERELEVGGLNAITHGDPNDDTTRWQTEPRLAGHRLDEVTVDSTTYAISHDDSGRVTRGPDFDFEYDPRGRLYTATNASESEFYLHDGDGKLVHIERSHPNATVEKESIAYDGDQIIAAFNSGGNPTWEAVWGAKQDQLIESHDLASGRWYPVFIDHRNFVVASWSHYLGIVNETASYTPKGRLLVRNHYLSVARQEEGNADTVCLPPSGAPFAFNSMWRSPLTGLSYMRNRWYSPRLAQFTSHDPLGFVGNYSLYGFAMFDPFNGWVPSA